MNSHIFLTNKVVNYFYSSWLQLVCSVLFLILFLIFFLQAYGLNFSKIPGDLENYMWAGRMIHMGFHPYQTDSNLPFSSYPYPLFWGFVVYPLNFFPPAIISCTWFSINLFGLFLSILFITKISNVTLHTDWGKHLLIPLFFVFLILFSPLQNNFRNAQVNCVILFSCIFSLYLYTMNYKVWCSFFLSIGIAIKLLPLIFLFYFLLRKQYKVILWTFFFTGFFLFLPIIDMKREIFHAYSLYLFDFLLDDSMVRYTVGHFRIMTNFYDLLSFLGIGSDYPKLRSLTALGSVLLIISIDSIIKKRTSDDSNYATWIFSLYFIGMLFVSPITEKHHLVFLVPPVYLQVTHICFTMENQKRLNIILLTFFILFLGIARFFISVPFYSIAVLLIFVNQISIILTEWKNKNDLAHI